VTNPEEVYEAFHQKERETTVEMLLSILARDSHEASHRWFPETADSLAHHTLALCGEAGEVANLVKKIQRGSLDPDDPAVRRDLENEVADVFIYLLNLVAILKMNLGKRYMDKQKFNQKRF